MRVYLLDLFCGVIVWVQAKENEIHDAVGGEIGIERLISKELTSRVITLIIPPAGLFRESAHLFMLGSKTDQGSSLPANAPSTRSLSYAFTYRVEHIRCD